MVEHRTSRIYRKTWISKVKIEIIVSYRSYFFVMYDLGIAANHIKRVLDSSLKRTYGDACIDLRKNSIHFYTLAPGGYSECLLKINNANSK